MKAFVFAAGLGTRLRPLTDSRPKALVEVAGKTLLEWNLLRLRQYGVTDVIINVHHFAEMIQQFLLANANFGLNIVVSDESGALVETGGALKKAASLLQEAPFLVHNVDIVSDIDLEALCRQHGQSGDLATLAVTERAGSRSLLFDGESRLRGWRNNQTGELRPAGLEGADRLVAYAFSGVHVLSPGVLPMLLHYPEKFSIMDYYIDQATQGTIGCYVARGSTVIDVGRLESLDVAAAFLR